MTLAEAKNKLVMSEINIELDEGITLVLREAKTTEVQGAPKDGNDVDALLRFVLEKCFVSLSVTKDDGSPADWKDAYDLVSDSVAVSSEILQAWGEANPLASRRKKKGK